MQVTTFISNVFYCCTSCCSSAFVESYNLTGDDGTLAAAYFSPSHATKLFALTEPQERVGIVWMRRWDHARRLNINNIKGVVGKR